MAFLASQQGIRRTAAFDVDSLGSTRPIEFEVVSPADSEGMFDVLTYEKGAAVVRMLEQWLGADAFRTATGVHAAAVIKAIHRGDDDLADRVYSGVPAGWFGKQQAIEIGFMSGESNVVYWLESRGIEAEKGLVDHIFGLAKKTDHILSDGEIQAAIAAYRA